MTSAPEFSRPVRLDELGEGPRRFSIEAEPEERAALVRRFALQSLDHLRSNVELTRSGDRIRLTGTFDAKLVQSCIASGDPVPASIAEPVTLIFVPEAAMEAAEEEIELSGEDCDTLAHDGRTVDMGEAIAQSLGLAMNPYPRSPAAQAALRAAGVASEEEEAAKPTGPFGALAGLKAQLEGKK